MKNRTLVFLSGKTFDNDYSVEDLKNIADNYSELKYSAAWQFGHENKDGSPAAGWVRSLEVEVGDDGIARLYANSDFNSVGEEAIKSGCYENKSISLYTPDSVYNPHPGTYSLRHIAMLGGSPPALKNLGRIYDGVEYAEGDTEYLTYSCSCETKKPTTIELSDMKTDNMKTETMAADMTKSDTAAVKETMTDAEHIAMLEAELEALRTASVETIQEDITEEQDKSDEALSEVEQLKLELAQMQAELNDVKEANTALTISSAVSPYYSEGILTEDVLPESTLTRVVTKLTLGLTNYSEAENPLNVIEALLTALNQAAPTVEYGETWTEPKAESAAKNTVSYSNGDEMHELAVATAQKYTLSYGKALSAIVKAKELSEAKSVDFSETLSSVINPTGK